MTPTLVPMSRITHAHVTTTSRDCDGRYDNDFVWFPPEGKDFALLWAESAVSDASVDWDPVTFERGTTPDGFPYFQWFRRTDEGFREEYCLGCDDPDCDPNARRYRDYTAEAMGY